MKNNASIKSFPKDFTLMVIGQIVSILGATLLRFALSLYVLDITGRADVFATLYAISSISLLLSPLGGAIADRFNRRNLMVIYDLISSAVILCFIFALSIGNVSVILIGVVMILLAFISSMYSPVLGGVLYGIVGLKILVVMSCITFFLSAVLEMFIKIPFVKRKRLMKI